MPCFAKMPLSMPHSSGAKPLSVKSSWIGTFVIASDADGEGASLTVGAALGLAVGAVVGVAVAATVAATVAVGAAVAVGAVVGAAVGATVGDAPLHAATNSSTSGTAVRRARCPFMRPPPVRRAPRESRLGRERQSPGGPQTRASL